MNNSIEIDVAVVGSGAAGFAAALTAKKQNLDVHIFEKAEVFGGTTATSGGVAWLPGNHLMNPTGGDDSDRSLGYVTHHAGNRTDSARIQSYIDNAPRMLRYFTDNGFVKMDRMEGFPDYRAETPGGDPADNNGGRSVEPLVFPGRKLGDWMPNMRHRPYRPPVIGTMSELRRLASIRTNPVHAAKAWRAIPRTVWGRFTGANYLASGAALIGWLACAARELGIPLHLSSALQNLEVVDGRVVALTVKTDRSDTQRVAVRKGIILATGGFDHNTEMRRQYMGSDAAEAVSAGVTTNTGDGHCAVAAAGGVLSQMDEAWWAPTCDIPNVGRQIVIFERGKPGQIIVDAQGRRFTNEAQPYGEFVRAQLDAQRTSGCAIPAFMIFDQSFRDRYPTGPLLPGATPKSAIESGFLTRGEDLASLAAQLDINASGLENTVARFNKMAEVGEDSDFQRGNFAFDRYSGDPSVGPNPCLAPIVRAPFYAIRIYPGDLGTNGGALTNQHAQVLDQAGQPIQGLYAAGNCAASVLGGFYPGAGGTIGPAMTFGYLAALHLSQTDGHIASRSKR